MSRSDTHVRCSPREKDSECLRFVRYPWGLVWLFRKLGVLSHYSAKGFKEHGGVGRLEDEYDDWLII